MSMPRVRNMIPIGCVVTLKQTKFRSNLTVFKNAAEIRKLHPYLNTGTVATDILNYTPQFGPNWTKGDVGLADKSIKVKPAKLRLMRIKMGWTQPRRVKKTPHSMAVGYFYWIAPK